MSGYNVPEYSELFNRIRYELKELAAEVKQMRITISELRAENESLKQRVANIEDSLSSGKG